MVKPGILKKYTFDTFNLLPYCEILYFHGSYYEHTCLLGCAASTIYYLMVDGGSTFLMNQHTAIRMYDHISEDSGYTTSSCECVNELPGSVNGKKLIHFHLLGYETVYH